MSSEARVAGVADMIDRHGKDRVAYWFQLVLAMGIATYGLVLGSTGVVIGAMLVSPLMGPIIEIGMGLVTGSPVLVLSAGVRTLASVAAVVSGAALLTLGVPYHELNGEILARTSPTLIDLYVASFCALAAAYTTARRSSDTISAAAGTAISIALVPPLCVVGWGLGSGHPSVSRGAAMLFTANFSAIVLFAMVTFFFLAYDTVDVGALEAGAPTGSSPIHRAASRLRRAFGSKYAPVLGFGMPLVLAATIYVPLRRALEEVAWKVSASEAVQRVLSEVPAAKQAVRVNVNVEMKAISLRLVIVSDQKTASKLKAELVSRISTETSVTPVVDVVAVPDLDAVRVAAEEKAQPIVTPRAPALPEVRRDLDEELRNWWPRQSAGELATWSLHVENGDRVGVRVVHFGAPLGGAAESMLGSALGGRLGVEVSIRDVPLSADEVSARSGEESAWVSTFSTLVDVVSTSEVGYLCVTEPEPAPKARPNDAPEVARAIVRAQLQRLRPERSLVRTGGGFAVRCSPTPCPRPAADAGVDDASRDR